MLGLRIFEGLGLREMKVGRDDDERVSSPSRNLTCEAFDVEELSSTII